MKSPGNLRLQKSSQKVLKSDCGQWFNHPFYIPNSKFRVLSSAFYTLSPTFSFEPFSPFPLPLFLQFFPFDVRCWTFNVGCSSFYPPLPVSPTSILPLAHPHFIPHSAFPLPPSLPPPLPVSPTSILPLAHPHFIPHSLRGVGPYGPHGPEAAFPLPPSLPPLSQSQSSNALLIPPSLRGVGPYGPYGFRLDSVP